ncbi:MAG: chromate efflux transporter [Synechococcales cyanobacterium RM1_1_8]|nr:chromate efflux transporter [Synechococcales cyanobacterium RM1_1_8]
MESTSSFGDRLRQLIPIFLKLGSIGFGGPQAHIAMMSDEFVVRRGWISAEAFAEGMAICEMLPGPASTQMGIYSGYLRAGQLGALVAGICFIAPAWLIVVALAWGYFRFQGLPQLDGVFLGVSPVVVAIILAFCWKLGKKTMTGWAKGAIALASFCATLLTPLPIVVQFLIAGAIGLVLYRPSPPGSPSLSQGFLPPLVAPALPLLLVSQPAETLALSSFLGVERIGEFFLPLTLFFLKVGSFIFGGGLVIIPLLEAEVVEQLHWLTTQEFINGVAIGQLSPGPVVLTAAFVGYKVAGVLGALVSAIAIFAPSFAFIMLAAPLLQRLRRSPWVRAFLQGVTAAVLGAIVAASMPLLGSALGLQPTWDPALPRLTLWTESWPQTGFAALLLLLALVALIRYKLPTWQLVPAGALLGLIFGGVWAIS